MGTVLLRRAIWLVFLAAFALSACATVEKPEIVPVEPAGPRIDKTLAVDVGARFLKRKVAIARFSNETKYGQGLFLGQSEGRLGKQAADILAARLAATDRFILLERTDIDKILAELKAGGLKRMKINADYLIIGSVSEFGRQTTSDVGVFSRVKKQTATARVNVRLVEVATGRVIYSAEGEGQATSEAGTVLGVGATAGYDSSLNDKAISAAISKLVNNVIANLMDRPWRSYILGRQGEMYIIAGGRAQNIMVGDVFGVYAKGRAMTNPQTGLPIELPGKLVAKLRVTALAGDTPENEISICELAEGAALDDFDGLYLQDFKLRQEN